MFIVREHNQIYNTQQQEATSRAKTTSTRKVPLVLSDPADTRSFTAGTETYPNLPGGTILCGHTLGCSI